MGRGGGRTFNPLTASQTRILGRTAVVKMSGSILGLTAQSLNCLVADMCLTADPGVNCEFDPGPVPYFQGD